MLLDFDEQEDEHRRIELADAYAVGYSAGIKAGLEAALRAMSFHRLTYKSARSAVKRLLGHRAEQLEDVVAKTKVKHGRKKPC